MELDQFETEILDKLFHPESYRHLKEEYSADEYILRDCLRSLARKKLMYVMIPDGPDKWRKSFVYDTDKLQHYRFQLTSKGFDYLSTIKG